MLARCEQDPIKIPANPIATCRPVATQVAPTWYRRAGLLRPLRVHVDFDPPQLKFVSTRRYCTMPCSRAVRRPDGRVPRTRHVPRSWFWSQLGHRGFCSSVHTPKTTQQSLFETIFHIPTGSMVNLQVGEMHAGDTWVRPAVSAKADVVAPGVKVITILSGSGGVP